MSISVKGVNALGGLLVPGDMVEVWVTRPAAVRMPATLPVDGGGGGGAEEPAEPNRWESVKVLGTAFRVLAVNQRLARSRAQVTAADQYQSAGEAAGQQIVTLEVTEPQAKAILEQTGAGQLPVTLLLCPPNNAAAPPPE